MRASTATARQLAVLVGGLVAAASVWAQGASAPVSATPVDPLHIPHDWLDDAFCAPAQHAPASAAAVLTNEREGHLREAAAQALQQKADAATAEDGLSWALRASRLFKALGCDDAARAALRSLSQATAAHRDRMPAALRCTALAWQARLASLRQIDEAEALAIEALACAQRPVATDLADAASEALATRMVAALSRGDRAAAEAFALDALALPASAVRRAEVLRLRAGGRADAGARAEALADCQASLASARDAGDAEAQGLALVCVGHLRSLDDPTAAVQSPELAAARRMAMASGMRRVLALALYREGSVRARSEQGRHLGPAAAALQASASLVQAVGDAPFERAVQLELAQLLLRAGDIEPARTAAERAGLLSRQAGLALEAAKAEQTLGTLSRLADPPDLDAAERHFDRAWAGLSAAGAGPLEQVRLLMERAAVASGRGDDAAALVQLQQALSRADGESRRAGPGAAAAQALVVDLQAAMGWALAAAGRRDEAELAWRLALQSARPTVQASAWWGLARLARDPAPEVAQSRYARAAAAVAQARPGSNGSVAMGNAVGFDRRVAVLLREYSAFLVDRGQLALAHQVALLTQQEELRQRDWVGTRGGGEAAGAAPSRLEACDDDLQRVEREALAVWARYVARRQTGLETCCRDDADTPLSGTACSDPALASYCPDRRAARVQRLRLVRLQDDCMASIETALRAAGAGPARQAATSAFAEQWSRASAEGAPVHLVVTIVEDTRLIVLIHAPADRQYRARSVAIDKPALVQRLSDLQHEWDNMAALRRSGARADDPALTERAQRLRDGPLTALYHQLFDGFDPPALPADPPAGAVLAFVPDGPLRELPLGALFDGRRYLLERWAPVLVTPTTLAAGPVAGQRPNALVMGVSEPDLPNVASEVRRVAHTLGAEAHLNDRSTRQRVREWLAGVENGAPGLALHLASHAVIGGSRGSSHIRLWGDDRISGDDLDDWRDALRRVRLVTLSACRSSAPGRGDMALGLSGIAEKGARSVLGSLWPVDDESTSLLMGGFYAEWASGPGQAGAVAAALARAQRAQMRSHPHPYFWAAFHVIGRWD